LFILLVTPNADRFFVEHELPRPLDFNLLIVLVVVLGLLAAKQSRTKDEDEDEHDWRQAAAIS
jgi:hypothetical protein